MGTDEVTGTNQFPMRVVVEAVNDGECTSCARVGTAACVVDALTMIDGSATIEQLVPRTLHALGLQHLQNGAKGLIEICNWKPQSLESLTDLPTVTAEALLREISTQATLRIITKPQDEAMRDTVRNMRDRLLRTILSRAPHIFNTIKDTPLREFVAQILSADASIGHISEKMHTAFEQWLDELTASQCTPLQESTLTNSPPASHGTESSDSMRLTQRFHSLIEVPQLVKWLSERGSEPTQKQLQEYANTLNNSTYRRNSQEKISTHQVSAWFAQARQLQRLQFLQTHNQQQAVADSSAQSPVPASTSTEPTGNSSGKTSRQGGFSLDNLLQAKEQQLKMLMDRQRANEATESDQDDDELKANNAPSSTLLSPGEEQNGGVSSPESRDTSKSVVNADQTPLSTLPLANMLNAFGTGLPPVSLFENIQSMPLFAQAFLKQAAALSAAQQQQQLQQQTRNNETPLNLSASIDSFVKRDNTMVNGSGNSNKNSSSPFQGSRSRLMFDPLTELPLLERWFEENPHPSWVQIDYFTESLNSQPYRKQYPPISTHNVKIWFKNRRAKCKRMNDGHAAAKALKHPKLEAMTH